MVPESKNTLLTGVNTEDPEQTFTATEDKGCFCELDGSSDS